MIETRASLGVVSLLLVVACSTSTPANNTAATDTASWISSKLASLGPDVQTTSVTHHPSPLASRRARASAGAPSVARRAKARSRSNAIFPKIVRGAPDNMLEVYGETIAVTMAERPPPQTFSRSS